MNNSDREEPATLTPTNAASSVKVDDARLGPGAAHTHDESFSGNRVYDPSEKHGRKGRVVAGRTVQKAPNNGQAALDTSVRFSEHTQRRVGVDIDTGEFVVLDRTGNLVADKKAAGGVYHGHVRTWNELEPEMQNALEHHGLVDSRGRITVDPKKWDSTP